MKQILNKMKWIGLASAAMFIVTSCTDVLDEQPRAGFTPSFFSTQQGVEGGITSLYAHLRYMYGSGYTYNASETGTDEYTWGESGGGIFAIADMCGVDGIVDAVNNPAGGYWGTCFPNINTASGIIENASTAGVAESLVAEAYFFRAYDYFLLVQTFGGVPLDLGAGELKFNTSTYRKSVRNTVPEVYTKAIFPDLLKAITDLPDKPRVTGGVTKNVARLYLSKAYLTYAWWLKNPENIPTYPACDRTDPDNHDAAWYFQQAYDIATYAIDNPGVYGLMDTYYQVNAAAVNGIANDRNKEIMLYADHTQDSELYNDASLSYGSGGGADNFAGWMATWNYTQIQSTSIKKDGTTDKISSVQRDAVQALGRPWTRMAPTIEAIKNTFADKTNDSRYDGTFTTVYRANWNKGGASYEKVVNANNMEVKIGDPILIFLNEDNSEIKYPGLEKNGISNIGAGTLDDHAEYVVDPSGISRRVYPGLWKLGPYRTDSNGGYGQPNAGSTRPYNIAKFSEFYFIAAEAAVEGANTSAGKSARDLINVIRARAGKWMWDNNGNCAKEVDNSAAMIAATPANIDINYILSERSREYFGEGYRWLDLVRTQKWNELGGKYTIASKKMGDHESVVFTRDIKPFHYLRPIPQGQLDGMEMTAEEKKAYQNPGY